MVKQLQEEIYLLALELADARGWDTLGKEASSVWTAPARWKTESENKAARRVAMRVISLLKRIRELLGGQIGLDNFFAWQLLAGLRGNHVWGKFCLLRSQDVLRQVWENEPARKLFESQRRTTHMVTPSAVNALKRASHSTQRNMVMTRALSHGQVHGNETLLQAKFGTLTTRVPLSQMGKISTTV